MDINISEINKTERERLEIYCHNITNEITEIVKFVKSRQGQLEYKSLSAPLKYALLGIVPIVIMYSHKELSNKQLIIRKVIQFLTIETEFTLFFLLSPTIDTSEPKRTVGLMISVFAVYVISNVVNLIISFFTAQKITKDLIDFQKSIRDM